MTEQEKKLHEPKDLGLKIGSKEEAAWTLIRNNAINEMEESKRTIILDELIIKEAEQRIEKEKSLNSSKDTPT